jgi:hypothetical protein
MAILKAHGSFYSHLGQWRRKRKEAQKTVYQPNKTCIFHKSIIWEYYLNNKKKFADLPMKTSHI